MTLLLLEALGALLLLVFIVWWTMFAGRKRGEPPDAAHEAEGPSASPPATADTDVARSASTADRPSVPDNGT